MYFAHSFFSVDDLYYFIFRYLLCHNTNRFLICSDSFFLLILSQFHIDLVYIIIIFLCRLINCFSYSIILGEGQKWCHLILKILTFPPPLCHHYILGNNIILTSIKIYYLKWKSSYLIHKSSHFSIFGFCWLLITD